MPPDTQSPKWPRQRGATLLIALIMLVIMTLVAVTSFNIGDTNLKIVANAQEQQRVRGISEQLMNDRLHKIADGLSSNPCDITTLAAADGSLTETLDGVSVTFTRTLLRCPILTNDQIKTPWVQAVDKVQDKLEAITTPCAAGSNSEACKTAKAELQTAIAERDRAKLTLDECLRKPPTSTSLSIQDPALEGGGEDKAANEDSYCANVEMELRADASDSVSNAGTMIVRGLSLQCSTHDVPDC